jgi:hypothetical protein
MAETIAKESTSPEELEAALANLPTATSDAVVAALGHQSGADLAAILHGVLNAAQIADLKAAL